MRRGVLLMVFVLVALFPGLTPAYAQIALRFTPQDTTLALGGTGRLSIVIEDTFQVRTTDLRVTFDSTVVRSVGGGGGALYTDSGHRLFQGFENSALDEWYGFTVIIGADDSVAGPGELFYWDFEAVGEGVSPVQGVQVFVSAADGSWYPTATLATTTIVVSDGVAAVGDLPVLQTDLKVWPNPFNPRAQIGFNLQEDMVARLAVYDAAGRRLAVLLDGPADAGPLAVSWDGRDEGGRSLPGGVYLFRLTTARGTAVTRGVLLK